MSASQKPSPPWFNAPWTPWPGRYPHQQRRPGAARRRGGAARSRAALSLRCKCLWRRGRHASGHPAMRRQGGGVIVNISSILGKVVVPSLGMVGSSAGYTASKYALNAFSAAARMELASDHIHVVTILPGVTASEFNDHFLIERAGCFAAGAAHRRPHGRDADRQGRPAHRARHRTQRARSLYYGERSALCAGRQRAARAIRMGNGPVSPPS